MQEQPKIWALFDDRMGTTAQTIGVANAFHKAYETKKIVYTKMARLPNILKGASLVGISQESRQLLLPPYPDIVITAGRRLASVARYIKKKSPATALLHIMYPGQFGLADFDMVAVPEHDSLIWVRKNIVRMATSPHSITAERLDKEKSIWRERLAHLPPPFTAVFVGGSTKDRKFTVAMAERLGGILKELAAVNGGSILITTSRRTGTAQEQALADAIPEPRYFYRWSDGGDNPYFAFMANAGAIIVTGDSVSMCSESCSVDVPVYIYAPSEFVKGKHRQFVNALRDKGLAKELDEDTDFTFGSSYTSGNPVNNSADKIVADFNKVLASR